MTPAWAFLRRIWHWRRYRSIWREQAAWYDEAYGPDFATEAPLSTPTWREIAHSYRRWLAAWRKFGGASDAPEARYVREQIRRARKRLNNG